MKFFKSKKSKVNLEYTIQEENLSNIQKLLLDFGYDLLEIWEKEKFTVLFDTHSVSEAIYLSQRVLVLSSGPGKIVYEKNISQYISKEEFRRSKEFQAINSEIFEKLKSGVNNE